MNRENLPANEQTPVYNIKAVARLVGLLPVTLRAWERRYGLPSPQRGDQGYRLYSEYDVRILRWLKGQTDAGMSIGRASDLLLELCMKGQDPAVQLTRRPEQSSTPAALQEQFIATLTNFDDTSSNHILRRAFSLYSIDQVLLEIIQPTLVALGEAWHQGKLPIAVEHFASQFCLQNLMSMLASSAPPYHAGTIVAACAPGEMHQIGLLMLVVMLRWRGWDVKFLGQDLKLDRLPEALAPIRPRLLLFTATRQESAANLSALPAILKNFPPPVPQVVLGGQGFDHINDSAVLPGALLRGTPTDVIQAIEKMMTQQEVLQGSYLNASI
jgi:MerR family transcriptional regulator, light-induced transcriptional regulator